MKFEKLKPGMIVYDVGKQRMGNTTMSSVAVWSVKIIEVNEAQQTAIVSWNGNPNKLVGAQTIAKYREKKPLLIEGAFGYQRLPTRDERKALLAKKKEAMK